MVNWDCHLQTAVADDEIEHKSTDGHFWHLRYPVIDPEPGEPGEVIVATTRPETMLGDTAVAVHPDPAAVLEERLQQARERLAAAPAKQVEELTSEVQRLESRVEQLLPSLIQLAEMAAAGRMIQLPIVDRKIPLIADEWAKPELGSGCVKITPAHDPNDHEVWQRHQDRIEAINILNPDGTLNEAAGPHAGEDRFEARKAVVRRFEQLGLLEQVEDRVVEVGHSDRSKTPVEPYLSLQWFVRMGDIEGGVRCAEGLEHEFRVDGLAQAAIDAVSGWSSHTGRTVSFHPDPDRYRNTYVSWLAEKRDWCISRQLWWGHQIPIWSGDLDADSIDSLQQSILVEGQDDVCLRLVHRDGSSVHLDGHRAIPAQGGHLQVCLKEPPSQTHISDQLEAAGLVRDPDVLDTWFSSALWPHSHPRVARSSHRSGPRRATLARSTDQQENCLDYYYPGSCLVTGRISSPCGSHEWSSWGSTTWVTYLSPTCFFTQTFSMARVSG